MLYARDKQQAIASNAMVPSIKFVSTRAIGSIALYELIRADDAHVLIMTNYCNELPNMQVYIYVLVPTTDPFHSTSELIQNRNIHSTILLLYEYPLKHRTSDFPYSYRLLPHEKDYEATSTS